MGSISAVSGPVSSESSLGVEGRRGELVMGATAFHEREKERERTENRENRERAERREQRKQRRTKLKVFLFSLF